MRKVHTKNRHTKLRVNCIKISTEALVKTSGRSRLCACYFGLLFSVMLIRVQVEERGRQGGKGIFAVNICFVFLKRECYLLKMLPASIGGNNNNHLDYMADINQPNCFFFRPTHCYSIEKLICFLKHKSSIQFL